jgi:hypothetical protein
VIKYESNNMYESIYKYVIPKWRNYLINKFSKNSTESTTEPRLDTIWKKILRDVREFYRTLFRVRFHYLDFKDTKGAQKCIEIMFEELAIPLSESNMNDINLFKYIHQSHKNTSRKLFKNKQVESDFESPFDVIERFNDASRKKFMSDLLGSKLFYFVFSNFLETYYD